MSKPNVEPTREEIEAICREIRKEWSEKEHCRRMGYPDGQPVLTVPRVHVCTEGMRL